MADAQALLPGPEKGRKMSRARAWFEIKRYFDADARRFAHKEVYARELLLKTVCESLQRDGFVVIDSYLAQHAARGLRAELGPLRIADETMEAPAQVAPWVGSQYLQRTEHAGHLQRSEPGVSLREDPICRSCEITMGGAGGAASLFQPRTKDEFLRSVKTVLHCVAANSTSEAEIPEADKVHVQLTFGDLEALERAKAKLGVPGASR
ncbi:unnamed protein product [Effrenium voratum]|uniref:Uncharacterized protein n=1 Tax=Effrenium voratum TaxID=2562239 RepID=A0AA36JC14_9DINO|nr:unnamed protein product [Effrenium voratum]CAJ1421321.1 unnamed protein product [Effrenium voratum]